MSAYSETDDKTALFTIVNLSLAAPVLSAVAFAFPGVSLERATPKDHSHHPHTARTTGIRAFQASRTRSSRMRARRSRPLVMVTPSTEWFSITPVDNRGQRRRRHRCLNGHRMRTSKPVPDNCGELHTSLPSSTHANDCCGATTGCFRSVCRAGERWREVLRGHRREIRKVRRLLAAT